MISHKKNFVKEDKKTEAMHQFIKNLDGTPVGPDIVNAEIKGYSKVEFGKLGEQYIKCIFKNLNIQKIKRGNDINPDFEILLNGKKYRMEAKSVSNLYSTFWNLLGNIYKEGKQDIQKLIKVINEEWDINLTPFEIHEEDQANFKVEISKILKGFDLKKASLKTIINCPKENYKIEIKKKKKKIKGIESISLGWLPKETNTLANFISKKRQQIGKCDILSIILLNNSINYTDLEGLFYMTTQQLLFFPDEEYENIPSFNQLDLDKTIWGTEFKNKAGGTNKIGDKLKCIIVFYPENKTAYIFPSVKIFNNFLVVEYTILKETIKGKGFTLFFASHKVEAIRV